MPLSCFSKREASIHKSAIIEKKKPCFPNIINKHFYIGKATLPIFSAAEHVYKSEHTIYKVPVSYFSAEAAITTSQMPRYVKSTLILTHLFNHYKIPK